MQDQTENDIQEFMEEDSSDNDSDSLASTSQTSLKFWVKYGCIYFLLNFLTMVIVFLHQHKSPQNKIMKYLYKAGLAIYYLITFLYLLIIFPIQREHAGYYIVYTESLTFSDVTALTILPSLLLILHL